MVKKIFTVFFAVLLLAYMGFSVIYLKFFHTSEDAVCQRVEVEIENTPGQSHILEKDIISRMKAAKVFPVGKNMNEISASEIEEKLADYKLVKKAECFKTAGGYMKIKVYPRIPVLRVFAQDGSYYVDSDGNIMPVVNNFAACVPVACGNISSEYATNRLYGFAKWLHKNKFWDSQIAQIYVTANRDIILTPVVGNHRIILGKIEDYKGNLDKLQTFYRKGLNKIGWNRYSTINLKYRNQVVCTLTSTSRQVDK